MSLTTFYADELAVREVHEEDLGNGISIIHFPLDGRARDLMQFLADLTARYADAITEVERASDAAGWRCPQCRQLLSEHKASWNDYAFDTSKPLNGENQPVMMWDSWASGSFCYAADWRPSGGLHPSSGGDESAVQS